LTVASTAASAKKRAPNAPGNNQQQQPIYGTLPHSVGRYQQSYDLSDIYNSGNNISTLPHPPKSNSNNVSPNQQQQHFDNKVYERFEPYINKTSHKRSPSSDSISRSINLGEIKTLLTSIVWCIMWCLIYLAGAKLVLPPAGEIPQLKPVNANRPRMPPPQTPNGKNQNI
jgi:hypothetical protein